MTFRFHTPSHPLSRYVDCFWTSETKDEARNVRVTPDGCTDIIWKRTENGSALDLVGAMTHAHRLTVPRHSLYVGIRLRSGVRLAQCAAQPMQMLDQSISLSETHFAVLNSHLSAASCDIDDLLGCAQWLVHSLVHREELLLDREVEMLLRRIDDQPSAHLDEIYAKIPMSIRTIQRRFIAQVGLTPKLYARIRRYRMAEEQLGRCNNLTLTDLSYVLGYADQAHLSREFRQFCGVSPTEYLVDN